METFFNLEREISMATEAMLIEHNIPCTRRFTHDELAPSIKAIREIEAAKAPSVAQINAAMMEILKGSAT